MCAATASSSASNSMSSLSGAAARSSTSQAKSRPITEASAKTSLQPADRKLRRRPITSVTPSGMRVAAGDTPSALLEPAARAPRTARATPAAESTDSARA